jgi:hypothetical protein
MNVFALLRAQWDRAVAVGAVVLGALALLLGWRGISGTSYITEQLPYFVSGSLLGVVLVLVGAGMWLSADLRDEWRKLDALDQSVLRLAEATAAAAAPAEPGAVETAEAPVPAASDTRAKARRPARSRETTTSSAR